MHYEEKVRLFNMESELLQERIDSSGTCTFDCYFITQAVGTDD